MATPLPDKIQLSRILLQRYSLEDELEVLDIYRRNKERLIESFPKTVTRICYGNVKDFLKENIGNWNSGVCFFYAMINEDKKMIGQVQVKNLNFDILSCELGYFIDKNFEKRGYTFEALYGLLKTLFGSLQFERVFVRIIPSNESSVGLITKLGFKKEGTHRREFKTGNGSLVDVTYYSILKEELL